MQNSCPRGKSSPEMPIQIDDGVRKRKRRARQKKDRRAKLTEDGTGEGRNGEKPRKWSAGREPGPRRQTVSRAGRLEDAMGGGQDGEKLRKWSAGRKPEPEPQTESRAGRSEGGRVGGREGWRTRWAEGGTARSSANGERDRRMVSSADREPEPLSERRDCKQDARRCYRSTRNH